MKTIVFAFAFALVAQTAAASSIDPATTEFPVMNGAVGARYKMSENTDKVHVFEAFSLSCSWCNRNAAQVAALHNELSASGVQVIDLGLDSADRDYQRWIAAHNPPYPVVKDTGRAVWNALMQENGIPQTFVVGCDGSLVGYTIGYWGTAEKQVIRDAVATARRTTCD